MAKQKRRPLKVAIDGRMISNEPLHGISRYALELLKNLKPSGEIIFYLFVSKDFPQSLKSEFTSFTFISLRSKWLSLGEQGELPYLLWKYKIDLFHSPSFMIPFLCPCPFVITLHDMNHLALHEYYSSLHKIYYQSIIRRQVKKAFRVLTVSQFSKSEIKKYYGPLVEEKTLVVPNGLSLEALKERDLLSLREKLQLPTKYLFCLSNGKAHKNIERLVLQYATLETTVPLVICGKLPETLHTSSLLASKKFLHFESLSESELSACYTLAHSFIFPSLYEGFGLPSLEALALGTRVICSKRSSLPEILGDKALYFDPEDDASLRRALALGLELQVLSPEEKQRGVDYAKSFKWSSLSKRSQDLYRIYAKKTVSNPPAK